jgi:hypothetical protein
MEKKIEDYFERIRDIAQGYLDTRYPQAPDPDLFIIEIEKVIQEYGNCSSPHGEKGEGINESRRKI